MDCHESALDVIYEDDIFYSDVEEGELEDEECSGVQPMDVDRGKTGLVFEGEISAQDHDPFPGETVDSTNGDYDNGQTTMQCSVGCIDAAGSTGTTTRRSRRSKKKRRSGKCRSVDLPRFVRETCDHLQEKKISLIWALVRKLGVDAVRDLVNEVKVIEKCGGQLTNDKKRRRTPGGVLWNILRGRVKPEVYKEIMSQGNEVLKQKAKASDTLKRQRMDVDEPDNKKRRKMTRKDGGTGGKPITWPTPCTEVPQDLSNLTDGPVRDDSRLPTALIQKAWVDGLKKKDDLDDVGSANPGVLESGSERTNCPVGSINPSEKAANVVDRLRVPVAYSDLEKGVHDEENPGEPEIKSS